RVVGGGHEARPRAEVAQAQAHDLHGIVGRHEHAQLLREALAPATPLAVAGAVADLAGRRVAGGLGRGRPDRGRLLVAQVERLARPVADGVAAPAGEPVLAAVDRPGEAEPGL